MSSAMLILQAYPIPLQLALKYLMSDGISERAEPLAWRSSANTRGMRQIVMAQNKCRTWAFAKVRILCACSIQTVAIATLLDMRAHNCEAGRASAVAPAFIIVKLFIPDEQTNMSMKKQTKVMNSIVCPNFSFSTFCGRFHWLLKSQRQTVFFSE